MTDEARRARLSQRFDLGVLETDPANLAAVAETGSILWVNEAWRRFGAENGAPAAAISPGVSYFDAAQGELRDWIVAAAATCLAGAQAFESDYECSSATTQRQFRMRMLPVPEVGLLISHSLRLERAHPEMAQTPDQARYRADGGAIVMCSNCRRVRRSDRRAWDWVPAWVHEPVVGLSHGICDVCLEYYWPASR